MCIQFIQNRIGFGLSLILTKSHFNQVVSWPSLSVPNFGGIEL